MTRIWERIDVPIGPEERKLIENLNRQRQQEIERLEEKFREQVDTISKGDKEVKKRFYLDSKSEAPTDIKYYSLVNVQALKEFIKYGSNKVLDQIRIRSHADTLSREAIAKANKKGGGIDTKSMMFTLAIAAIVAIMVYVIVANFFNYDKLTQTLVTEQRAHGTTQGELANCQTQLDFFKPGTIPREINATGGSPPPNNGVLQG
jgi:hypothetical protein